MTESVPTEPTREESPPVEAGARSSLRQQYLIKITKRLVTLTAGALAITAAFAYGVAWSGGAGRTYLVLYVFIAGLIGGFVSIQQRLPRIGLRELQELSGSWLSIVLIPINGGIFAVVLHLIFLSGILEGSFFPDYYHPKIDPNDVLHSFTGWMSDAFPKDGPDIAKLFFWSFVAGFSERFVPQIIRRTAQEAEAED